MECAQFVTICASMANSIPVSVKYVMKISEKTMNMIINGALTTMKANPVSQTAIGSSVLFVAKERIQERMTGATRMVFVQSADSLATMMERSQGSVGSAERR